MQMTEILAEMGGLESMARELGVSESQAATGAEALIPAVLGGFKKQAQAQPAGLEGFSSLLGQLGGGGLLDNVLSPQPTEVRLGQRHPRTDLRLQGREPHRGAGRGVPLRARSLPPQEDAPHGGDAGRRLHGAAGCVRAGGRPDRPGLGGLLGGLLGGPPPGSPSPTASAGLASILDLNGDGNPLDDILGMAGKMMR